MNRADLHIHTVASGDSTLQPADIFEQAVAAGLSAIAFTDHDGIAANAEGRRLAAQHGIEFLAGIEMSSSWEGRLAHLLGYFPNGAGSSLHPYIVESIASNTRRNALTILEYLRPLGYNISVEEYDARAAEMGHRGSPLYELAFERGFTPSVAAYQAQVATLPIEPGRSSYPPLAQNIAAIHAAGGFAILAHPFAAPDFFVFGEEELETLAGLGLDGVEVFHPVHEERGVIERYTDIAGRLGLIATGGSDSHGKAVPPSKRFVGGMTCDWDVVRERMYAA